MAGFDGPKIYRRKRLIFWTVLFFHTKSQCINKKYSNLSSFWHHSLQIYGLDNRRLCEWSWVRFFFQQWNVKNLISLRLARKKLGDYRVWRLLNNSRSMPGKLTNIYATIGLVNYKVFGVGRFKQFSVFENCLLENFAITCKEKFPDDCVFGKKQMGGYHRKFSQFSSKNFPVYWNGCISDTCYVWGKWPRRIKRENENAVL